MKLYRQTARFVLFGILIASLIFGIQTLAQASAGVGPEPGANCKPPNEDLKVKYVSPPYFVDIVASFTGTGTTGTARLEMNVTSAKNKACKQSLVTETQGYSLADFNKETTKEALRSLCISNVIQQQTGQVLFCDTQVQNYLEVIAVAEYKKVGQTVTATLIVMEITF
jgi:hypothetical protein